MARVEVETKKPDIHIIVDTGTNKDVVQMVKELYEFIATLRDPVPNPGTVSIPERLHEMSEYTKKEEKKEPEPVTIPGMRDRLPNNVVDPSTLTVTEAVKENALVRCPHCGQNHVIALKSNGSIYVMRMNYGEDNYEILTHFPENDVKTLTDMCYENYTKSFKEVAGGNDKEAPKAYWQFIQSVEILDENKNEDFVAGNETEIFCPVCGKSEPFAKWKDCYENPLNYFEYDVICDACGGEMSMVKKQGESFYKCDKCGWTADGEVG